MKKLVFLFAAVLFTAISANVFAQTNTGVLPSIGSTHEYYVNSTDGTSQDLGDVNNTFIWWVSTNASDLTDAIAAGTEFTVENGTYGGTGGVNNYKIELTWNPVSITDPATIYYLVVQEFDTDGTTCSNMKAVAIQPVNNFDVTFAAINESDVDADNPSRCAPDISLTATGTTITYDYGSDSYIYKITSAGLYSDWTFDYEFTNTLGVATPTIEYSTDGSTYASTGASSSKTVTPTAAAATVYFRITLDNGDTGTPATSEEGLSGQTMVLTLTNLSDGSSSPAHIYTSDGSTEFTGDVEQIQTVKSRPGTSTIGYN